MAAWMAAKRSAIGISPVGTSMRASENAFEPRPFGAGADRHAGPQLLDGLAELDVVLAGRVGRGGEERRVQRAAQPLRRGLGLAERGAQHLHAPLQRTLGPQRRVGPLGVAQLAHHAAHRVGGGRAGFGNARRIGQQVADLADEAEGHPQPAGEQVAQQVLAIGWRGFVGRPFDAGRVDGWWLGRVAVEVEELQRQLHAALAVGDGVVQLLDQRRLAAAQTVDHRELPQRTGALERVAGDQAGQVEQLAHRARLGQRHVADVVVDVEAGSSTHIGAVRFTGAGCTRWRSRWTTVVARSIRRSSWSTSGGRSRTVTLANVDDEVRVLLETPHQAFGVAHLAIEVRQVGHGAEATAVQAARRPRRPPAPPGRAPTRRSRRRRRRWRGGCARTARLVATTTCDDEPQRRP